MDRQIDRQMDRWTDRETDTLTDGQRLSERQADTYTLIDRWTEIFRQTGRQTHML